MHCGGKRMCIGSYSKFRLGDIIKIGHQSRAYLLLYITAFCLEKHITNVTGTKMKHFGKVHNEHKFSHCIPFTTRSIVCEPSLLIFCKFCFCFKTVSCIDWFLFLDFFSTFNVAYKMTVMKEEDLVKFCPTSLLLPVCLIHKFQFIHW